MTITLSNLLNFPLFYEQVKKEKIPIMTAYKLSKLKKEIDFHLNFYQENLRAIVLEYSQKDEQGNMKKSPDGQNILLIPESTQECIKKIEELANFEVNIADCDIKIEDFGDIALETEIIEYILPLLKQEDR